MSVSEATKSKSVIPAQIDRFRIVRSLGAGSQGTVLLAMDERLSRRVALKMLKPVRGSKVSNDSLDPEARISSQLQHPNLVTLYEIGTYHHLRYLVFEFVDGESLKERLARESTLNLHDAVIITSQILAGLDHLHSNGIVHRDLSPANILLTHDGVPKVTDFGISTYYRERGNEDEFGGTLPYMSPEPFAGLPLGPYSDVFSLGAILFEMIAGKRLMHWSSKEALIHQITEGSPEDECKALDCDDVIKDIVVKALQRATKERYQSARDMKKELDKVRVSTNGTGLEKLRHGTVDFLLRRMRHKKGFSALSGHITKVLELTSENSGASADRIANILAKDLTLSQSVLTAANSAFYGNTEITTLARAIVLLGADQVRMCVAKALIERQFDDGSPVLHDALIRSFFSAVLAKAIAHKTGFRRIADAFTCGMFHDLGRTLTIHYFAEEYEAIIQHMRAEATDETTAAAFVLGIAYADVGASVAGEWKFPESIIRAMRPLPEGKLKPASDDDAHLAFIAAFANAVCSAALDSDLDKANERIQALLVRTQNVWEFNPEYMAQAFIEALSLSKNYARLLKVELSQQPSLELLSRSFSMSSVEADSNPVAAAAIS